MDELGMEDPDFNYEIPLSHFVEDPDFNYEIPLSHFVEDLDFECFSSDPYNYHPKIKISDQLINNNDNVNLQTGCALLADDQRPPKKLLKKKRSKTGCAANSANNYDYYSSSTIISFEKSKSHDHDQPLTSPPGPGPDDLLATKLEAEVEELGTIYIPSNRSKSIRSACGAQEHVNAERKRREKMTQQFIALSAVIPDLKKRDKASILGEATKYLKHLQGRVKTLEDQVANKTMESAVFVKKFQVCADNNNNIGESNSFSSGDEFGSSNCSSSNIIDQLELPEVEIKVSNKDVLVRIHCENKEGCLVKILSKIEMLNLNVLNTSAVPFGNSTIDVTVVAQMDANFSMSVKDLVRNLRRALL